MVDKPSTISRLAYRGGVRREDRVRLGHRLQYREDVLLQFKPLGDGLNDQPRTRNRIRYALDIFDPSALPAGVAARKPADLLLDEVHSLHALGRTPGDDAD